MSDSYIYYASVRKFVVNVSFVITICTSLKQQALPETVMSTVTPDSPLLPGTVLSSMKPVSPPTNMLVLSSTENI